MKENTRNTPYLHKIHYKIHDTRFQTKNTHSEKNTAAKDTFFVIAKERVVDRAVGNKRSREEKLNAFGIP